MKVKIKVVLTMLTLCVIIMVFTISSYAATGFEGYAIHRDGAFIGITWHAGLMGMKHTPRSTCLSRMQDNLTAL